jgi:hypothetical protein
VSEFGEKVTIVETLSENGRAVAITVNAETAAGGFVTPGDYVDVILTQGGGEELRAVTILQNIRVIAVDQDANEQSDTPQVSQTVTVDVTPQQGQALALAQRAGRLSLMLRDFSTEDDEPMRSLRLSDVLLEESPLPEEVVRARTITVRRGIETETVAARGNALTRQLIRNRSQDARSETDADPQPITRFAKDNEDGTFLVIWGIGLAVFLGLIALSFDLGRVGITQTDLQSYADSAALAAAGELDQSPATRSPMPRLPPRSSSTCRPSVAATRA